MFHTSQKIPLSQITELNFTFSQLTDFKKRQITRHRQGSCPPPPSLKCRGFRATSLSTYDFSTLYTTSPHNLIKEILLDLIEWTFKRALKINGSLYLACNDRKKLFSLPLTKVDIHFGHVKMYAAPYPISWIMFILDSEPSLQTNCWNRWVQIAPLS